VRRALADLGSSAREVVLVGGPAGDDEVLDALASSLPGTVAGRADAAGVLGHRWAVAWGLVLAAS
jgi:sugar (pentulose or hexulose) kinase